MLSFLLLSCILKALPRDEAFHRRVLTRVDPMKFSAGLCPGNPVSAPRLADAEGSDMIGRLARDGELRRGLLAARDVYELADLEANRTGASFVDGLRGFFGHVPDGYELYFFFADPDAGLKYMVLQPLNDGRPWILGVAGTQTTLDWIQDLDLGRKQIERIGRIRALFTTCQYLDPAGRPLASHAWIFAGHSLGGGIAQAIAYDVQKARVGAGLNPLSLRLVTFNGFGARSLFPDYDERLARTMRIANFFVQGDEVSRIGEHIGPTYVLTPAAETAGAPPRLGISEIVRRHAMTTVESLTAVRDGGLVTGLGRAPAMAPPERKVIRALLPAATWLSRLIGAAWSEDADDRVMSRLRENVDAVVALDPADQVNARILNYTKQILFSRHLEWTDSQPGLRRQGYLTEIERMRARLDARRREAN